MSKIELRPRKVKKTSFTGLRLTDLDFQYLKNKADRTKTTISSVLRSLIKQDRKRRINE